MLKWCQYSAICVIIMSTLESLSEDPFCREDIWSFFTNEKESSLPHEDQERFL